MSSSSFIEFGPPPFPRSDTLSQSGPLKMFHMHIPCSYLGIFSVRPYFVPLTISHKAFKFRLNGSSRNLTPQQFSSLPRTHAARLRLSWTNTGRTCPKNWFIVRFSPDASSETQGLSVGTMRYFRASHIFGVKLYLKGWRVPGHFSSPNEFQTWSKSVPLIGQEILFSGQSTRSSSRVILSPSYTKWVSSLIDLLASPLQRGDSREEFQNKDLTKKRRFLHCFFRLRGKIVEKTSLAYLIFLLDRCTTSETFHDMQIAVARATQLCDRPNVGTIG